MSDRTLSEFDLIARLTANLPRRADVTVGVGDDAAVLRWTPSTDFILTCDAQVEGRHFVREYATPEQIGRRAMAVNLSDIAAMGGEPLAALVSLILPADTAVDWLDGLYAGLRGEAQRFGVSIVGGNVASASGPLIVDITLVGRTPAGGAILRSGGHPGDRLCVTGHLGAAAAGLMTFRGPARQPTVSATDIDQVREAYVTPRPRIEVGMLLAASGAVTAMVDVSDGLAADLGHLCAESRVGARIEASSLPIDAATRSVAQAYELDPLSLALYEGDDYELLFSVHPDQLTNVLAMLRAAGETATPIGWLLDESEKLELLTSGDSHVPLAPRGWDHLRLPSTEPSQMIPDP